MSGETYILGSDVLAGGGGAPAAAPPQYVFPSVNVYPIVDATDVDFDLSPVVKVETIVGEQVRGGGRPVLGQYESDAAFRSGPSLWPRFPYRKPEIDIDALEAEIALAENEESEVLGAGASGLGPWPHGNLVWPGVELEQELRSAPPGWEYGIGLVPPGPTLWTGTEEELVSRMDWDRSFDEGWDENLIRRTGRMRG